MIITTNIRLPEEQWKALKIMAVHAGTSVSALLRQAVQQILKSQDIPSPQAAVSQVKRTKKIKDPFFDLIGMGSGGPSDDSLRHDLYLYKRK